MYLVYGHLEVQSYLSEPCGTGENQANECVKLHVAILHSYHVMHCLAHLKVAACTSCMFIDTKRTRTPFYLIQHESDWMLVATVQANHL